MQSKKEQPIISPTEDNALLFILNYLRESAPSCARAGIEIASQATSDLLNARSDTKSTAMLSLMTQCFEAGRAYENKQWNKIINRDNQQTIQQTTQEIGGLDRPS